MSNFVRMFKPQFAAMVESSQKLQTVRPVPKRMPKAGDRISLRTWTGKPYRSKQRVLGVATVVKVLRCLIGHGVCIVGHKPPMTADECDAFARADGFRDRHELRYWFEREHGLPFNGIVIYWKTPTK